MHKKITTMILSMFLLAGCSFFGDKNDITPVKEGEKPQAENYDQLMAKLEYKIIKDLVKNLPEYEMPEKYESDFNMEGTVAVPGAGSGNFTLSAKGKADLSEGIKGESEMELSVNTDAGGQDIVANAKLGIKNMGQELYFSLVDFSMDNPELAQMVDMFVSPYKGVWYGGDLRALEDMIKAQTGEDIDLTTAFKKYEFKADQFNLKKSFRKYLQELKIMKMVEGIEVKDNMASFKVELDKEGLKSSVKMLIDELNKMSNYTIPSTELNRIKSDIDLGIDNIEKLEGVISIDQKDVKNFTFDGELKVKGNDEIITIKAENSEEKTVVQASAKDGDPTQGVLFEIVKNGDMKNFTLSNADKSEIVAQGKYSDDIFEMKIMLNGPSDDTAMFSFKKESNIYKGTIEIPSEEVKINIDQLAMSKNSFLLELNVTIAGVEVFSGKATSTVKEVLEVSIEKPENPTSFEELFQQIANVVMGGMGETNPMMEDGSDYDSDLDINIEDEMMIYDPAESTMEMEDNTADLVETDAPTLTDDVMMNAMDDMERMEEEAMMAN
ncbi:MAG: hypothetical protein N4A36_02785 [Candidatus Gracilibacteria bacterium]|jgi:hypothetical protein|nr:hypothetical protein [Candidatus Gracilibacteria bacterium]